MFAMIFSYEVIELEACKVSVGHLESRKSGNATEGRIILAKILDYMKLSSSEVI